MLKGCVHSQRLWRVQQCARALRGCVVHPPCILLLPLQDGYPRTTQQAKSLDSFQSVTRVVNIVLPLHVLTAKMLARRVCGTCGRGYNLADIQEGACGCRRACVWDDAAHAPSARWLSVRALVGGRTCTLPGDARLGRVAGARG